MNDENKKIKIENNARYQNFIFAFRIVGALSHGNRFARIIVVIL